MRAAYAGRVSVAVRVIPCLDVDAGRVVKGVNFVDLRDAGDPVEMARAYDAEGADELVFLDVTASSDSRETTYDVVRATAEQVFIPLTVGGGVRTVDDVDRLLRAGADKVGVNTAAIARPKLIAEVADRFGNQVLVLSVDARRSASAPTPSGYEVTTHGGRRGTGIDAVEWAEKGCALGAGEILLNSMDADGTQAGFDTEMISAVRAVVDVPVIASGGFADARGLVAALALGAEAMNLGTRFVATKESPAHINVKNWLVDAAETDTMFVMRSLRNTERVLRNEVAEKVVELESRGAGIAELAPLVTGKNGLRMLKDGEIQIGLMPAGQSVGLVRDIPTVSELVNTIMEEARQITDDRLEGMRD